MKEGVFLEGFRGGLRGVRGGVVRGGLLEGVLGSVLEGVLGCNNFVGVRRVLVG